MSEHNGADRPAKKPVDYDELFPGRFIKAGLFQEPRTLTIAGVDVEALPEQSGKERKRGVLSFKGKDMQWVLNSTNGQCLRAMFGRKVQDWIGKRVTLICEQDRMGGDTVDAIRVAGSPDMAEESMAVLIDLGPRRKPRNRTLTKTKASQRREPGDD